MDADRRVLAVDVGSTATKAALVDRAEARVVAQARAATTVEAPDLDVTIGLRRALQELERACGRPLLAGGAPAGTLAATSSAGGGLQVLVAGVMRQLTAESAERAALGAGAIVVDVLALDDGRTLLERVARVRELRPDIILLAGGTDEGNPSQVLILAETLAAARPRSRLGDDVPVPVVFAGAAGARGLAAAALEAAGLPVRAVPNLRPSLEREELAPAREELLRLFLEHVMARAPGYARLLEWAGGRVLPTPVAVGRALERLARRRSGTLLAFDVGGATTDVFSAAPDGPLYRSVRADLGMSYGVAGVLERAGISSVLRWLPAPMDERQARNRLLQKLVRPAILPEDDEDLALEQAVAREALRLSFEHHRTIAVGLKGVLLRRTLSEFLRELRTGRPQVDPDRVDVLVGSGGPLSHAPRPGQALLVLLDAVQPRGVTRVYLDRGFLLPHVGALLDVDPELADRLLEEQCLLPLGTCVGIAHRAPAGAPVGLARVRTAAGEARELRLVAGALAVVPLPAGTRASVEVLPAGRADAGAGPGRRLQAEVEGGAVGLVLDARGRPPAVPEDAAERRRRLAGWLEAVGAYPPDQLAAWAGPRREVV